MERASLIVVALTLLFSSDGSALPAMQRRDVERFRPIFMMGSCQSCPVRFWITCCFAAPAFDNDDVDATPSDVTDESDGTVSEDVSNCGIPEFTTAVESDDLLPLADDTNYESYDLAESEVTSYPSDTFNYDNNETNADTFNYDNNETDAETFNYDNNETNAETGGFNAETDGLIAETDDLNAETDDLNAETDDFNADSEYSNTESDKNNTESDIVNIEDNNVNETDVERISLTDTSFIVEEDYPSVVV